MYIWEVGVDGDTVGGIYTQTSCIFNAIVVAREAFGPNAVPFIIWR